MNPVRRHFKMNLPAFVLCAAKELGVPVQAVQAVTWYIWKYTGKTAPLEAPTGVYDVSQFVNAQPANDISLDEVNAIGAGGIVGAGIGNGGTDASKKLLWSGDEPLKEFINRVVENVLDKMQQKHVGGASRKSPYGDTYVGFSSGSEEDGSGREKQAGIVKKVNNNLNKKPYTLHDPPSMGISITRPTLKDRK
jgi:hypothetical protein